MSEQLKQELEADTDRLETGTVVGSETIGEQEEKPTEGKLEARRAMNQKKRIQFQWEKPLLLILFPGFQLRQKKKLKRQKLKMQS